MLISRAGDGTNRWKSYGGLMCIWDAPAGAFPGPRINRVRLNRRNELSALFFDVRRRERRTFPRMSCSVGGKQEESGWSRPDANLLPGMSHHYRL